MVESIFLQIQTETEKECTKREIEMKTPAQWDILRNQLKGLLTNDKQEQNQLKTLISKFQIHCVDCSFRFFAYEMEFRYFVFIFCGKSRHDKNSLNLEFISANFDVTCDD